MQERNQLLEQLAIKAIKMSEGNINEIEKYCWMIVHEHRHGVLPVEYDIKDIDQRLYLNVLTFAKRNLRIK